MTDALVEDDTRLGELIAARRNMPGALLPILHAVQAAFGHISDAHVAAVAAALNLSRAEVHGAVTFYHDFRRHPRGRHVLRLCRAEACQSMGCEALAEGLVRRLGIELGETTADGRLTLEAVYCLGNCALSPAAILDGKLHGRIDAGAMEALLRQAEVAA
jgi:formate dehydrogenase subunit gamma